MALKNHGPGDCCCDEVVADQCSLCNTDRTPYEVQVVVSGIVDGISCTECELLNGTYVLPQHPDFACVWQLLIASRCLNWINAIELALFSSPSLIDVIFGTYSIATERVVSQIRFRKSGFSADCDAWSAVSLPHFGSSSFCSGSLATCTVTAV